MKKSLSRSTLIALAAAALGLTALAPAYAQPFGGNAPETRQITGGKAHIQRPDTGFAQHRPGSLIDALIAARDAEAVDVAAIRLTHQLGLTDAQQSLLSALKADVLTARETIDAAREALAPVSEDEAASPDLTARYAGMVAMTSARAEALAHIQPAFEAFVAALDDEQRAALTPERPTGTPSHGHPRR